ncbi:MAG: T9SS type A sorting domain-containing protein [Bacteroidetes bacterium]|nr:T9SS type A sorting domain-containing protein [Bacteroidota bacterium]
MKKLALLFTVSIVIFNVYAQTGWYWQNPLPQGNPLNSIHFCAHSGWAVGENGTALHMKDYGEPWELIDLGTDENLNGVYMHDDLMAFIVGDNGLLLFVMEHVETNTYEVKKLDSNTDKDLFSVTSDINGCPWVSGDEGMVLRSDDFGETWEKQQVIFGYELYQLSNIECTEAWVVGRDGSVKYTYDLGNSWSYRSVPTSLDLLSVHVGTFENIRVVGQQGGIWHTSDKGLTWEQEHEEAGYQLYDVINIGLNAAYAVGTDSKILETIDYGETWTEPGTDITLYDTPLNDVTDRWGVNSIYAVGHYGVILENSGIESEFELQTEGQLDWLHSVDFANDSVGWAVGGQFIDVLSGISKGIVLGTTNGGETWELLKQTSSLLSSVDFINETEGWAVGRDGTVLHTTSSGAVWGTQESPIGGLLTGVSFVDENNGWVVSRDFWGEIIHTTNGGNTWTTQTNPSGNPLHGVFFINENKGWAVGLDTTIIRTTDGGQNWLTIAPYEVTGARYADVFFIDEMKGWVVGTNGRIVLSEDGGISWQEIESGTNESLESVFFIDHNNGWAAGDRGTILRSVDGGYHWFKQDSHVSDNFLVSIHFTDALKGWAVGSGGTIIHTTNGGFSHENGTFWADWIGLPILDNEETKSTIEVIVSDYLRDEYYLTGLEIFIDSIMHSRVSDLEITLAHHDVTETLVYHVTDHGANFLWTKLTDEATTMITDGTAPFSGNHKPYQPLTAFNGMDPNGEWTLTIYDSEDGHEGTLNTWGIKPLFEKIISIDEKAAIGSYQEIMLSQNIPNPFTAITSISWNSEVSGKTVLKVFNINGQEIATLVNGFMPAGEHTIDFDGSGLSTGLYYYQLRVDDFVQTKKMILHK